MLYELDIFFSAYDIRSNLGLSIKFDLKFNLKFLVNTESDFRRRADVTRCPRFDNLKIIVETCSQRLYRVIGYADFEYGIVNNM